MPKRFSTALVGHSFNRHRVLRLQRDGGSYAGSPYSVRGDFHALSARLDIHTVRLTAHVRMGSTLLLLRHIIDARQKDGALSMSLERTLFVFGIFTMFLTAYGASAAGIDL